MPPNPRPRRKPPARGAAHEDESGNAADMQSNAIVPMDVDSIAQESPEEAAKSNSNNPSSSNIEATQEHTSTTQSTNSGSPPPRRPVERLASAMPRSSSNTPTLAEQNRPAMLKFKPKSFIRRSKEEREAIERAEEERRAARLAAEGGVSNTAAHGRRGGGGGMADMEKWKQQRFNLSHGASGHLGGSTLQESSSRGRGRPSRGGGRPSGGVSGGGGGGSQSSTGGRGRGGRGGGHTGTSDSKSGTRMKKEPGVKPEKDKDGDIIMGSSKSKSKSKRKIKEEEDIAAYASSEGEFDSDGAQRVDIEKINLISSEDEDSDDEPPSTAKGKQRQRLPAVRHSNLRPVRVQRQEHVDRQVGVHTEPSSKSAELRRKAQERNEAGGPLFMSDDEQAQNPAKSKSKAKPKRRDVEFLRDERKWKGVYQEDKEKDDVKIKDEPKDDGVTMVDKPMQNEMADTADVEEEAQTISSLRKAAHLPTHPDIQSPDGDGPTDEEQEKAAESDGQTSPGPVSKANKRRLKLKKLLLKVVELDSYIQECLHENPDPASNNDTEAQTASNPTTEAEPSALQPPTSDTPTTQVSDPFTDPTISSFIFQLPPLIPALHDPATKPPTSPSLSKPKPKNPSTSPEKVTKSKNAKGKQRASSNPFAENPDSNVIKVEDDEDTKAGIRAAEAMYTAEASSWPSGQIGSLTLHEGGGIGATWGELSRPTELHELPTTQPTSTTPHNAPKKSKPDPSTTPFTLEIQRAGSIGMGMPSEVLVTKFASEIVKMEPGTATSSGLDLGVGALGGATGRKFGVKGPGGGGAVKLEDDYEGDVWEDKVALGERAWGMGRVGDKWVGVPDLFG